jgi:wobble nucleotide-excising tRNase
MAPVDNPPSIRVHLLHDLIENHNQRVLDNAMLRQKAGVEIRDHILKQGELKHGESVEELFTALQAGVGVQTRLKEAREKIADLKSVDGSIAPSADRLTQEVRRILGRDELTFHPTGSGRYEIERRGVPAHGLSEGERTAITLVHFIELVRNHDSNLLGKPIVIIDDPVSSLDHGVFIAASSALWALSVGTSSPIEQILLLTHNSELFRQWDIQWEHYPKKKSAKNPSGLAFQAYELQSRWRGDLRYCELVAWPLSDGIRKKSRSEYHHAFISLTEAQKKLRANDSIEHRMEAQLLFPNVMRGLLETFLAFKLPGHMGDLSRMMAESDSLLRDGGYAGDSDAFRHNLLRFCNIYSHSQTPDVGKQMTPEEILPAIGLVFLFLSIIDANHFEGMCSAVGLDKNDLLSETNFSDITSVLEE